MFRIVKKRMLAPRVNEYVIEAEEVARHALPGQFIILRADDEGERIPFTICDYDRQKGTVTILVQEVGYSTAKLAEVPEGGFIADFVGPLGKPTDLAGYKKIALVGGGIGCAVIYPQAKKLHAEGVCCDVIAGARTRELIMYENEFRANCDCLMITTDDGSYGVKGFVTDALKEGLDRGKYDLVMAVGPLPMMKAVCALTAKYSVKTIVSMNPLMVDGTGMCGCCRVSVGGKTLYACVDGPEFDGHAVDWDNAIMRLRAYSEQEKQHYCRMTGELRK